MEGVAVAKNIEGIITAIDLPATVIILCVIAYFIIREVKKENESTRKSIESFKNDTANQIDGLKKSTEKKIDELKKHSDEKDEALNKRFEKLETTVSYIQHDYVPKMEHYQDTEGWKTEMQNVRQEVSKLPIELIKLINQKKG